MTDIPVGTVCNHQGDTAWTFRLYDGGRAAASQQERRGTGNTLGQNNSVVRSHLHRLAWLLVHVDQSY